MSSQKLQIVIEAQNKASKEIKALQKQIWSLQSEVQKATTAVSKGVKNTNSDLKKLKQQVVGTFAVYKILAFQKEISNLASQTQEVSGAFNRLSSGVWIASSEILTSLQTASKGTISEYNLMLSANKAMSLGVASSTTEFSTLMDIARVKAKSMWLTTTQAFNDIVTGLGRSSPLILDNLGITINASEAQEEYAKTLGKTSKELTDWERKQALINKVVKDGKAEIEEMGEIVLTASEKQQQYNAKIQDAKSKLWNALLPALSEFRSKMADVIEKTIEASGWQDDFGESLAGVGTLLGNVWGILVTTIGYLWQLANMSIVAWNALDSFMRKQALLRANEIRWVIGKEQLTPAWTKSMDVSSARFGVLWWPVSSGAYRDEVTKRMQIDKEASETIAKELQKALDEVDTMPEAIGTSWGWKSKAVKETKDAFAEIAKTIKKAEKEQQEKRMKNIKEYRDTVKDAMSSAFDSVKSDIDGVADSIKSLQQEKSNLQDSKKWILADWAGGIASTVVALQDEMTGINEQLSAWTGDRGALTQRRKVLRQEINQWIGETTMEEIEKARQLATESELERAVRERDEKVKAIEDEIQAIDQKIETEKTAHSNLTNFKIELDDAYQITFRANSLEQLSLYDQLIAKASLLRWGWSLTVTGDTGLTKWLPYVTPVKNGETPPPINVNFGTVTINDWTDLDGLGATVDKAIISAYKNIQQGVY